MGDMADMVNNDYAPDDVRDEQPFERQLAEKGAEIARLKTQDLDARYWHRKYEVKATLLDEAEAELASVRADLANSHAIVKALEDELRAKQPDWPR